MNANNLLTGKKADFLSIDHVDHNNNTLIYKDKSMTISHDGTTVYMSSTWWGNVKNSFFTLDGMKGSSKTLKHGKVEIKNISSYSPKSPLVDVNRHNKANVTRNADETSIQFLGKWIQANTGENITYDIIKKVGPDHAPTITVKIVLPDGKEFTGTGSKKQLAANNAAEKAMKELGIR